MNDFKELEMENNDSINSLENGSKENKLLTPKKKVHKKIIIPKSSKELFIDSTNFYSKNLPNFDYLTEITENNLDDNKNDESNKNNLITNEEETEDKNYPSDEFSQYLFEEINKVRENPRKYLDLIQGSESNIETDKNNRLIYKSKVKVALNKGRKAFEEAKLILSNTRPMEKLKYDYNITIKPPNKEEEIKSNNYLKNQIYKKSDRGITIKSYWREIIHDPETCFILMIVDDNGKKSGLKRNNILNPRYKYIGLSSKRINKSFACYITLR